MESSECGSSLVGTRSTGTRSRTIVTYVLLRSWRRSLRVASPQSLSYCTRSHAWQKLAWSVDWRRWDFGRLILGMESTSGQLDNLSIYNYIISEFSFDWRSFESLKFSKYFSNRFRHAKGQRRLFKQHSKLTGSHARLKAEEKYWNHYTALMGQRQWGMSLSISFKIGERGSLFLLWQIIFAWFCLMNKRLLNYYQSCKRLILTDTP